MRARAIALTVALCFVFVAVSFAAAALMGTWKLNEAKSKLSPTLGKNRTVVIEAVGDNQKITNDGIDSDGKPTHSEWVGKFDGKDYPVTRLPASEAPRSFSAKKINDHTWEFTNKYGGKVSNSGRMVISADGKTRTTTRSGTDSKGNKYTNIEVYEKQ